MIKVYGILAFLVWGNMFALSWAIMSFEHYQNKTAVFFWVVFMLLSATVTIAEKRN